LVALIALVLSCQEENDYQEFEEFVQKYDKHYDSIEEYMARYSVFKENLEIIRENRRNANEEMTWTEGVNEFSDLTEQEFRKYYMNLDFDALKGLGAEPVDFVPDVDAPAEWNWCTKGYCGAIKNQGRCGSCWAFSVMSNVESLWYGKTKKSVVLAEQLLVDCDKTSFGCRGGYPGKAFTWLANNGGVMYEHDYPYTAKDGQCKKNPSKYVSGLKLSGFKLLGQNENDMKTFLYSVGPLAAVINATPLQRYTGGIVNLPSSQCRGYNHAINLVGYGHDKSTGLDYWLVRNSWGASWGEHGYFRIVRGKGSCGINFYTTYALFK
jgi:C1A family cysteine protease